MVPAISPAAWLDLMEGKGLVYDAGAFPKNRAIAFGPYRALAIVLPIVPREAPAKR